MILLVSPAHVHSEPWWQIETKAFVIYTDVEQSDALQLAQHLHELAGLAPKYLPKAHQQDPAHTPATQDLELLIFAKRRDFARLLNPRHFVSFTRPGLTSTLLMVAPTASRQSLLANLRHEYAHYYLRKQKLYFPPWYDEGMASLFEHVDLDKQGNAKLDTTALFKRYAEPIRNNDHLSFKRLLSTTSFTSWPRQRLQRFYGLSGQLVHYFEYSHQRGYTDRRDSLRQFLTDGATDFESSLDVSLGQLEREFRRYRKSTDKPSPGFTIDSHQVKTNLRKMHRHEVLTVQARAAEGVNPKAALKRYSQAAELMPADAQRWVDVSRVRMNMGNTAAAEEALTNAKALAPGATGVAIQQAELLMRDCWLPGAKDCKASWQQASDMIHSALDQDPEFLDGVYLLGLVDLYRGRADLAANYLWIVHRYAPWVPKVNYHLGECLRLLGDSRARVYLSNARDWAQEDVWRQGAEASLASLKSDAG